MEIYEPNYTSEQISVPPEFENVFTHFYIAENSTTQAIHKTLFPSFQTILVFSFGSVIHLGSNPDTKIEIDKCIVLGPVRQHVNYTLTAGAEILVANFKDDAFYRFFGQVILFKHQPISPDDLLNENCFTDLWHFLKNNSSADRVNLILEFCKPYIRKREASFENFANFKSDYSVFNPIKVIARKTNQSERTVQLNHKKYFGYSAKEIGRYQKFLKAIELLQTKPDKTDWFEIISECGYYDQSQLIHDFKHYLNLSPTQFLKFQQDICRPNL